jgi:hypothetical protein
MTDFFAWMAGLYTRTAPAAVGPDLLGAWSYGP